jgi:DNA repair photolyase
MKSGQLPLFEEITPAPTLREVADVLRDEGIEGLTDSIQRADAARYQEVRSRSALCATKGMPFQWALNPYRGCTHACEYCYARKYQRHLELDAGDDFSTVIFVKRDLARVLARELAAPRWRRELVAVGTATDPYQPIEGRYRITRDCLQVLTESGTPFSIVTKGPMIVRDRDVLAAASRGAGAQVFMSVPSVDEEAWRQLEPGTAHPAQRLRALRLLADAGIETGVLMMPLVPGLTTSRASIERTMTAIAELGLRVVGANVARLDRGVKEHFYAFLNQQHPELREGYRRLYAGTHARADYVNEVKAVVRDVRREIGDRARCPDGRAVPECVPLSRGGSRTGS